MPQGISRVSGHLTRQEKKMQENQYRSSSAQQAVLTPPRKVEEGRIVQEFKPGSSTAVPSNVSYRIGRLQQLGILSGDWLDCGCADGGYTAALRAAGATSVTGVDPVEDRIAQAQERAQEQSGIKFLHASGDALPFPDDSFDGVLLNEVMEHVTDEVAVLHEIRRVLRSGGHLVIMSPSRWFPFEGHGMQVGDSVLHMPVPFLPWVPKAIGQRFMRARNYWPHELSALVSNQGFWVTQVGSVLPVFEVYPWLPGPIVQQYRKAVPVLQRTPVIRQFLGVSVLIVAQKP